MLTNPALISNKHKTYLQGFILCFDILALSTVIILEYLIMCKLYMRPCIEKKNWFKGSVFEIFGMGLVSVDFERYVWG